MAATPASLLTSSAFGTKREAHVSGSQGEGLAVPGLKREGRGKSKFRPPHVRAEGRELRVQAGPSSVLGSLHLFGSGAGRMLVRRGARAGRGMPRGWAALCLLSLLPPGFTNTNLTAIAIASSTPGISSTVPTTTFNQESTISNTFGNISLYIVSYDSNGTTTAISEPTSNFTSTSGITPVPGTMNSSVQSQTSLATTVPSTPISFTTSEKILQPSLLPTNISDSPYNSTSPVTSPTNTYPSFSSTQNTIKREIKCLGVKEVKLTQGICLERNETTSCEEFEKDHGKELTQVLCGKEQAGPEMCPLPLAQSETNPHCLLLVLANQTEVSRMLQLLEKHQFNLTKGEDPYYTENCGGQGYSSGPEASPEAQGKASVNQGAQENGTGQATSRKGGSARQHVVADTEL
ncbi:hematopoietic progenitor cell antigen CD34 isoform X2 [Hippopotamus amphibius kiboko]|uniref:hematopoietic progenitor cell antigen CD34 isoform X2 n=1 Tax=Hippopotamus amphibius kiboko TaxID=575201 RepID=UPI002597337E|nr:hematopoietic progenitor cell antigen CD34 isoform X2 [Hippopotamus amphibius kiboko]